ncbi:MAG: Maf family protein [Deltaproteobacteria bacterium]|nr:Maf family protein [Deltaproteobacteria bacterium]
MRVVLASASPRRKALLEAAGFVVDVRPADVDEEPLPAELPDALVRRLARAKATVHDVDDAVVAADTTVALGALILNKPVDDDDAARMLRLLSGCTHTVLTGWCVRRGSDVVDGVVATSVTFRALGDADIAAYLRSGEHKDKAGAYGIQGAAAVLVSRVEGSLTNVIGLPIDEVVAALRRR